MFGCSTNRSRGDAICANALTISERKATAAVVAALKHALSAPTLVQRFVDRFRERLTDLQGRSKGDATKKLDREVQLAEIAIKNLTDAIGRHGYSDAIGSQLKEQEAKLEILRQRRSATVTTQDRAKIVPHPKVIESYLTDLLKTLEADPVRGRALLEKHMGAITLTPESESPGRRFYRATGAFNLAASLGQNSRLIEKPSCGGRI